MDQLILVARVAGAFGVKGEVRITTFTAEPLAVRAYGNLLREDGAPGLTLLSAREVKGGVIARVAEVETRDQAEALRGLKLHVPREALPEPDEDEFYLADLIGVAVEAPDGQPLGLVRSVRDFGAGDLLEIAPSQGGEAWYLPFTRAAVPEVRLSEGRLIAVRPDEVE